LCKDQDDEDEGIQQIQIQLYHSTIQVYYNRNLPTSQKKISFFIGTLKNEHDMMRRKVLNEISRNYLMRNIMMRRMIMS